MSLTRRRSTDYESSPRSQTPINLLWVHHRLQTGVEITKAQ